MLFAMMHLLAGTVLSGALVTAVIATPALYEMGKVTIPAAFGLGVVLAIPVAWHVTRQIRANVRAPRAPLS